MKDTTITNRVVIKSAAEEDLIRICIRINRYAMPSAAEPDEYKETKNGFKVTKKFFTKSVPVSWSLMLFISKEFPEVTLRVGYTGKDPGQDCGIFEVVNGKMTRVYEGNGDIDAILFSYELLGLDEKRILKDYLKDFSGEGEFGNAAFVGELLDRLMGEKTYAIMQFVNENDVNLTTLSLIEHIAVRNDEFELAGFIKRKRETLPLHQKILGI